MASGLKYQLAVRDHFNQDVVVKIYQDGYTGVTHQLNAAADSPIVINWKGEAEKIRQAIIGSELRLTLMEGKYSPIIDDVLLAKDREYLVTVETTDTTTMVVNNRWFGFIVPDQIEYNFNYEPDVIRIRAIDPLIATKGLFMKPLNPVFVYGLTPLRKFFNTWWLSGIGFSDIIGSWWDVEMLSDISLTPEYYTNILDSAGVYLESMHDDEGKLITFHEAMERICYSMHMRCFMDNGKIYLVDVINYYSSAASFLGIKEITFKDNVFANPNSDIILLGNTEEISRQVAVNETKAKFPYKTLTGLVRNGNLLQWTPHPIHGGFVPDHWQMNDVLLGSNFWDRRVGSGRVESPYSYFVQNTNEIGGATVAERLRIRASVKAFKKYTIDITYRLQSMTIFYDFAINNVSNLWARHAVLAYNRQNPVRSLVLHRVDSELKWRFVDLSYMSASMGAGIFPSSQNFRGPFEEVAFGTDWQKQTIELPPIKPWEATGEDDFYLFVEIMPFWAYVIKRTDDIAGTVDSPSSGGTAKTPADAQWNPPFYIKDVKITESVDSGSQVVYLTRNNNQTSTGDEMEVLINTSRKPEAAGTLYSMIEWEHVGITYPPYQPLQSLFRFTESYQWNMNTPEINAISQLWINAQPQTTVKLEGRVKVFRFSNRMSLQRFYDSSKPFTNIYLKFFTNNAAEWDLKSNEVQFTVHSLDIVKKLATPFVDVPDNLHDKIEDYDTSS